MRSVLVSIVFACALPTLAGAGLTVTPVGGYTFAADLATGPVELSGLTYAAATGRFLAVSDDNNILYGLDLNIDTNTGTIGGVAVGSTLELKDATGTSYPGRLDFEGVTIDPVTDSVWAVPENGPSLRRYSLTTGNQLDTFAFATPPGTASHEALAGFPGSGGGLWTSNEESISGDRVVPLGRPVRLTQYNDAGSIVSQYFYDTGIEGYANTAGVKAMLLLDDGTLLILERVNTSPQRVFALYAVDLSGATDVKAIVTPDGTETPASKELLWSGLFNRTVSNADLNFEGLAIGPTLANGDRSLILVADNSGPEAGTNNNHFYALRLTIPEPTTVAMLLTSALLFMRRRRCRS